MIGGLHNLLWIEKTTFMKSQRADLWTKAAWLYLTGEQSFLSYKSGENLAKWSLSLDPHSRTSDEITRFEGGNFFFIKNEL